MKLSEFDYHLPKELIAEYPSDLRDEARLMVVHRDTGQIEHRLFKDIVDYFDAGDVLVLNNTKVFPARLLGTKEKTGAQIEIFLLRELDAQTRLWDVLVEPARKIRIGNKLFFGEDGEMVAEVIDNTTSRGRTIRFLSDEPYEEYRRHLNELGRTPLPKYIKREEEDFDKERYQTVYAKKEGAVAAPTAGLHFSKRLLKRLEFNDVLMPEITLHVGIGTFSPVEVEDLAKHKMDSEYFEIPDEAALIINKALDEGRRVCAVGTTVVRALESSVSASNRVVPDSTWTHKFIYPPYTFKIPNALITNFHLPKSTLLMLVAAFGGYDLIMKAYKVAVEEKYRFFSYGDAMLIL